MLFLFKYRVSNVALDSSAFATCFCAGVANIVHDKHRTFRGSVDFQCHANMLGTHILDIIPYNINVSVAKSNMLGLPMIFNHFVIDIVCIFIIKPI